MAIWAKVKHFLRLSHLKIKGASVKILVDNFGDEKTLPKLKLSIRKTAQEDFVELYDEVFSNDSPLSDHWKQNVY